LAFGLSLSEVSLRFNVPLKAVELFSSMGVAHHGELDLCEECGSPLEDGICRSCGTGFSDGASPVGAAPLGRGELSRVLGRQVGAHAHGSYALSMQQEEGMAPLRRHIERLVDQFSASPELKAVVKQNAERLAVKILDDLGPTKAAIASVAEEFLRLGRNLTAISVCISRVHPGVGRLRDLVVEVYPASGDVTVIVNGRKRPTKSHACGLYRRLRIPLFVSDGDAIVALTDARLTRRGYDGKRVRPLGPSEFVVQADDRNFELFKVIEKARLCGGLRGPGGDRVELAGALRRYSISKLPLTERLLRESGLLQKVGAEYARRYLLKTANGYGRSPKKLAEEALVEACARMVPMALSDLIVRKYRLKPSAMRSLIVKTELANWRA